MKPFDSSQCHIITNHAHRLAMITLMFILLTFNAHADQPSATFRVGFFQNEPIIFKDRHGNPQGLYVDLLNEIARQENWSLEYVFGTWSEGLSRLKNHEIDLMTSITYTDDRQIGMDFSSENILTLWGQVYKGEHSKIKSIIDLEGMNIAILKEEICGINFQQILTSFDIQSQITLVDTYDDAAKRVASGSVDACVINNVHGYQLKKKYRIADSHIMFNPFKLLVAVPKGKHGDLLRVVDRYISSWKQNENSFYYRQLNHWYAGNEPPMVMIPSWMMISLFATVILILISLFWVGRLRIQINQRKKAEEALRQSEALLESIFRAAPTGIGLTENHIIKKVNNRLCDIIGYRSQDLIEKRSRMLYSSEDEYTRVGEEIYRQIRAYGTGTVETCWVTKDGKEIDILLSSTPLVYSDLSAGVTFTALDITDRKQAERDLKITIQKLRKALDEIHILRGIVPICASCKKIRDDQGFWTLLETFINKHSGVRFSHGICPDCSKKLYPDFIDEPE